MIKQQELIRRVTGKNRLSNMMLCCKTVLDLIPQVLLIHMIGLYFAALGLRGINRNVDTLLVTVNDDFIAIQEVQNCGNSLSLRLACLSRNSPGAGRNHAMRLTVLCVISGRLKHTPIDACGELCGINSKIIRASGLHADSTSTKQCAAGVIVQAFHTGVVQAFSLNLHIHFHQLNSGCEIIFAGMHIPRVVKSIGGRSFIADVAAIPPRVFTVNDDTVFLLGRIGQGPAVFHVLIPGFGRSGLTILVYQTSRTEHIPVVDHTVGGSCTVNGNGSSPGFEKWGLTTSSWTF